MFARSEHNFLSLGDVAHRPRRSTCIGLLIEAAGHCVLPMLCVLWGSFQLRNMEEESSVFVCCCGFFPMRSRKTEGLVCSEGAWVDGNPPSSCDSPRSVLLPDSESSLKLMRHCSSILGTSSFTDFEQKLDLELMDQ